MDSRPIDILVVDDHPADLRLTEEVLAASERVGAVHALADGTDALRFLRHEGEHREATQPDLILLDLHLPGLECHEVLRQIKDDPLLHRIPVIVLSASTTEHDLIETYENRANACVRKPVNLQEFTAMIRAVESFWLGSAVLPGRGQN